MSASVHDSPAVQVSVIIPTYNCDRFLAEAIESVLGQSYTDYELLIVDDGSTDGTRSLVQRYGDRLRYIYQENQGVAVARNHGLQLAQGKYVAFLDADDVFLPHKLAAQVRLFETCEKGAGNSGSPSETSVGIVHSGWRRVDAEGRSLMEVRPWQTVPRLDLESWLRWKPVLPSAMLFRRDWLLKADGFDPRFPPAEDTDLVLRLALMGCESRWLRDITVCYRQHEASAMHKGLPQARSLSAVTEEFFARTDLPPAIRHREQDIRYSTDVWIAWYLHYTQHPQEMVGYLKRAWRSSPYSPVDTLVNWVESFAAFAQQWGGVLDVDRLCRSAEWEGLTQWLMGQSGQMGGAAQPSRPTIASGSD